MEAAQEHLWPSAFPLAWKSEPDPLFIFRRTNLSPIFSEAPWGSKTTLQLVKLWTHSSHFVKKFVNWEVFHNYYFSIG